jgi:hypothetical protein
MMPRALLLVVLALAGCERLTAALGSASDRQTMAHPYFPIRPGARWAYRIGQASQGVAMSGADSTLEVLAVRDDGRRVIADVVDRTTTGGTIAESQQQWVITREGLLPSAGPMKTSAGEVRASAPTGVYLPSVLDVDIPWSYAVTFETPYSTVAVRGRSRLIGFETLVVPAGRFELVAHVRTQSRTHLVTKAQPGMPAVPEIDQTQDEELYYARGVGLLRAVTSTAAGYRSEKELVRFTR